MIEMTEVEIETGAGAEIENRKLTVPVRAAMSVSLRLFLRFGLRLLLPGQ